jgi:chain length determinant protein (polysaccharide antigen chain regulator)
VSETIAKPNRNEEDEIDLVELFISLWKEKVGIITITLAFGILSALYAYSRTPLYSIDAEIIPPTQAEFSDYEIKVSLDQPTLFTYNPNASFQQQRELLEIVNSNSNSNSNSTSLDVTDAFSKFLAVLNSNSHISTLAKVNEELFKQTFNIGLDDDLIKNIKSRRTIKRPNTTKKTNALLSDSYTLSLVGIDRDSLKKMIETDLAKADETTTSQIKNTLVSQVTKKLQEYKTEQQYEIATLIEKIKAKKSYLLAQRFDTISELNYAFKIATKLGIEKPTNTSLLSTKDQAVSFSAELNNTTPDRYLKGTQLLQTEIEILKTSDNDIFIDDDLRGMEAQKSLLENNLHIKQLETEKDRLLKNDKVLTFHSTSFNAPIGPIETKKSLIVAFGILLGGFIGLLFAIVRIMMRKYKDTAA